MKNNGRKNILLTSVLGIVLSMSLIVGATFALFTSTASMNVAVTSGKVEITATASITSVYSPTSINVDGTINDDTNAAVDSTFANGGTASISSGVLTLTNLTPGDKAVTTISFSNSSNVKIKYRLVIEATGALKLAEAMQVTTTSGVSTGLLKYVSNWSDVVNAGASISSEEITFNLPTTTGTEYQNLTTGYKFTIEAIQGNVYVDNTNAGTTLIPANSVEADSSSAVVSKASISTDYNIAVDLTPSSDTSAETIVSVPAAYFADGDNSVELKVQTQDVTLASKNTNFSVEADETAVAAVDLELLINDVKQESFASSPVTVTTYIAKYLENVAVAYNGTATGVNITDVTYNPTTGELTFKTNHFSEYYAVADSSTVVDSFDYEGTWTNTADGYKIAIDDTNKIITITDIDDLLYFAQQTNAGVYSTGYAGYTINLTCDINLAGKEWTPINLAGNLIFDGNNHTIKNVYCSTESKQVGFFGATSCSDIKNLTIDGAYITGINHIGAITGYGICVDIENCHVKNATIITNVKDNDDGDKAGAIIGYFTAEGNGTLKNCTVENCVIAGYRDIGGLAGYVGCYDSSASQGAEVSGNSVKDITIYNIQTNNYKNYTGTQFDANYIIGDSTDNSYASSIIKDTNTSSGNLEINIIA